jgi:hypothetical protein
MPRRCYVASRRRLAACWQSASVSRPAQWIQKPAAPAGCGPRSHPPGMFVATEAEVAAIRTPSNRAASWRPRSNSFGLVQRAAAAPKLLDIDIDSDLEARQVCRSARRDCGWPALSVAVAPMPPQRPGPVRDVRGRHHLLLPKRRKRYEMQPSPRPTLAAGQRVAIAGAESCDPRWRFAGSIAVIPHQCGLGTP